MTTPEHHIPLTADTKIPFPCWLWNDNTNEWRERTKRALKSEGYLDMGYTHYCTSATEPTGRPGADGKWTAVRQEHESLKAIVDQERNPQAVRPLGPDEAWPNRHAVPTASGATGDLLRRLEATAQLMEQHELNASREGKPFEWSPSESIREAARLLEPASRPAVAQEGVPSDKQILDWAEDNVIEFAQAVGRFGTMLHDCRNRTLRQAFSEAMSSQPEGRG